MRQKSKIIFIIGLGVLVWGGIFVFTYLRIKDRPKSSSQSYSSPKKSSGFIEDLFEKSEKSEPPKPKLPFAKEVIDFQIISAQTAGFGSILKISFSVENRSDLAVKDIEIKCNLFGESGTHVGAVTETVLQVFPAHKKKIVKNFNMGGIPPQVAAQDCHVSWAKYL